MLPLGTAPALFTRMSTSGKRAATCSRATASDRSAAMVSTFAADASRIPSAAFCSASDERATSARFTPSAANHLAVASPMPFDPPVMSTLRPASFKSMQSPPPRHLSPGENRLALFPEGAAAFGVVGTVEAGLHQPLAGCKLDLRRHRLEPCDGLLDGADRQRRIAGDRRAGVAHMGLQLGRGRDAIDEAHALGFGGRELACGEENLLHVARAEHLDEPLDAGHRIAEAEPGRRNRKG